MLAPRELVNQPLGDRLAVRDLDPDPVALESLRGLEAPVGAKVDVGRSPPGLRTPIWPPRAGSAFATPAATYVDA